MAWLEITVDTGTRDTNEVAAELTARGFSDLVIEDEGEFESFLQENREYWDYIDESLQQQLRGMAQIRLYLEEGDSAGKRKLEKAVGALGLSMRSKLLPETNWEESWKDRYPPQRIGKRMVIVPYWLDQEEESRLKVILNPGLTFGTGAHPSTQMVIEQMEEAVKPGDCCLDLGSGSGILSIVALRLGAAQAVGVDIDPKAEDAARENGAYNGFEAPQLRLLTGNITEDQELVEALSRETYDVVLVNIVADVIIALAPVLPRFLGEKSTLICSGILDVRLGDVKQALEKAGLTVMQTKEKEEWRCVVCKRGTDKK